MNYKAKSYWYEVIPSDVNVQDIWGDRRKVAREDEQVRVLDYVFQPNLKGSLQLRT